VGDFLSNLGVELDVLAAPMAGGPTTPALVVAAAQAGSLGLLGGGYKSPETLAEQIAQVRPHTEAFGVNLFVPSATPIATADYQRYAESLRADDPYGALTDAPPEPRDDDDAWTAKLAVLLEDPVSIVSFTFAVPTAAEISALRARGSVVVQTVTSPEEARLAVERGVDALAVQGSGAGGHSGTFTPERDVVEEPLDQRVRRIRAVVEVPILAAGGIGSAADVDAAREAGARAVFVGTLLLATPEAGTSATHRRALLEMRDADTVLTRAFTGRPARALRNGFIERHHADAPVGYPALHHLTSPLRRAASAAGDTDRLHLWAGIGHGRITEEPAGVVLTRLAGGGPGGVSLR
jgi:NAD(P)H-dependent flavin oxidoreductase YrpB (nitropropane dioxygenase family)